MNKREIILNKQFKLITKGLFTWRWGTPDRLRKMGRVTLPMM